MASAWRGRYPATAAMADWIGHHWDANTIPKRLQRSTGKHSQIDVLVATPGGRDVGYVRYLLSKKRARGGNGMWKRGREAKEQNTHTHNESR